ncbi:MAG: hypothetical protein ABI183_21150 [Polyangiaceae bacterium]
MRRSFLTALMLAAALSLSGIAHADDQGELDKGRNAYLGRQYEEADKRFREMLDPKTGTIHDPLLINQAFMYWGAVMVALGRKKDASALFEQLLLQHDSHFEPDPLSFPTAVLDVFTDTREAVRGKIQAAQDEARRQAEEKKKRDEDAKLREAARQAAIEKLATTQTTIEHHSRWIALIPFGAGQFQNGRAGLGWGFLVGESALAVAAGVTGAISLSKSSQAQDIYRNNPSPDNPSVTAPATDARDSAVNWRYANLACAGAFVVSAVIGIVQANLEFQSDVVVVKHRPLPPNLRGESGSAKIDWHLTAAPTVSDSHASGATFGLVGRF